MLLLPKAHSFGLLNTRRKTNVYLLSPGSNSSQQSGPSSPKERRLTIWYPSKGQETSQCWRLKNHHSPLRSGKEQKDGSGGKKKWKTDLKAYVWLIPIAQPSELWVQEYIWMPSKSGLCQQKDLIYASSSCAWNKKGLMLCNE